MIVPIRSASTLFVDLDGVLYRGKQSVPHAVDSLNRAKESGVKVYFLTNNSSRTPGDISRHITSLGFTTAAKTVITSAQAAVSLLAETHQSGDNILCVGGPGLREALCSQGFIPVNNFDKNTTAVIQGFSPELSWKDLAESCYAVQNGIRWIATNPDSTLPTDRGIAPGNGSLVDVVRSVTKVEPEFSGKPFSPIFEEAIIRSSSDNVLVIGDRLDTDIRGANQAGLKSFFVLTGVNDARDLIRCSIADRPSYVAPDLSYLYKPYIEPISSEGLYVSGESPGIIFRLVANQWQLTVDLSVTTGVLQDSRSLAFEILQLALAVAWSAGEDLSERSCLELEEQLVPWIAEWGWIG